MLTYTSAKVRKHEIIIIQYSVFNIEIENLFKNLYAMFMGQKTYQQITIKQNKQNELRKSKFPNP